MMNYIYKMVGTFKPASTTQKLLVLVIPVVL